MRELNNRRDAQRIHVRVGEPHHDAMLAEVREIWLPRPDDSVKQGVSAGCFTSQEASHAIEQAIINACHDTAHQWMNARGLDVAPEAVVPFTDPERIGVRFSIVVGRATERAGAYRPVAWKWSARWSFWSEVFLAMIRNNHSPAHQAAVDAGDVINLDSRRVAAALAHNNVVGMDDE